MILQVVTDTDRRGAQVFATDLGDALAATGRSVTTVALAPGAVGGLDLPVLGPSRRSPRTLRALREAVRCATVVVAHGSTTLPLTAAAAVGTGVPFVYRQISDSLFWAPDAARRARVRVALARAAAVVALWPGAADVLAASFGVRPTRLTVIPTGVPPARFPEATPADAGAARMQLGLDPDRPTLAYVGALVPEKAPERAVEAVVAVPDAQLVVVGGGPGRAELEGLAARVAPGRVLVAGSMSDPAAAYAAADVVAFPSRGGDSVPAVLIEAGLSGRPAVATAVGGIPEVVLDGETGIVVDPDDEAGFTAAVGALLTDPARGRALGRAARAHCLATYAVDVVASRWADVLDGVVEGVGVTAASGGTDAGDDAVTGGETTP